MSTITKERVAGIASGEKCYTHDDVVELSRIALASLEVEAVAFVMADDLKDSSIISTPAYRDLGEAMERTVGDVVALYTAPPAPVCVPDEATSENIEILASTFAPRGVTYQWDRDECNAAADSWNACRAAMLQGGEPVTTAYKLPANTPCRDAPEHIWLQTAGIWPENGEFSELTWCSDNQHPDDTLYVRADVVAGNSPVIADGWVACSERMPPLKTGVIVGKWIGRSWATKWATYIPSHPEANSHGFIMPGGSWEPTHWMPLDATASSTAAGGEAVNNILFIGIMCVPYILNALQEILCNLQF